MMKNTTFTPSASLFFVILAAIVGGSVPVAAKYALVVFKPFTMVTLRFFLASIVLLPLVLRSQQFSVRKMKELFPVAFIGSLNPILLFIALQFTQASFSPVIYAGVPAMTAIYVMFVKKHTVTMRKLVGITVGLFGVCVIIITPLLSGGSGNVSFFGNMLIFSASIAFLFYGLISKEKQRNWNITPLELTFYFCLVACIVSLPLAGYELLHYGIPAQFTLVHIFSVMYIGIVGTGVFYLSYQYALKHSSEITASLFTYLQPISGTILAVLILGEKITVPFVIGALLAVLGAQRASN